MAHDESSPASQDGAQNNNALLAQYLNDLARQAFDTEVDRGRRLEDLSSQMLTCITIMSVAFITPASGLFDFFSSIDDSGAWQVQLAWMYAAVLVPLGICLILVLRARTLKSMEVLASPEKQVEYVERLKRESVDELEIAKGFCAGLQGTYQGMFKKNERAWGLLKASMLLVALSCVFALLFGFALLFQLVLIA